MRSAAAPFFPDGWPAVPPRFYPGCRLRCRTARRCAAALRSSPPTAYARARRGFTPRVRPAGRFLYMTLTIQLVEPDVRIRLQHPAELRQMHLRVNTFAVRRVREPHHRAHHRARVAVIAHVRPQTTRFGFSVPRQQHRRRRIIRVLFAVRRHATLKRLVQRPQQLAARVNPARQQRPAQRDALTFVYF